MKITNTKLKAIQQTIKLKAEKPKEIKSKKVKPKPCKYQKKGCQKSFVPRFVGQCSCYNPTCMLAHRDAIKEKRENQEWKLRKQELKEKLKTLGQYEEEAKRVFQKWIRQRDKGRPCISCNKFAGSYDGGHWWKSELYSGLIFHEDNCNAQCVYCNQHLHGNEANYRIGLVKRIGEERVKWLEENKDRLRNYTYTKQELIEIKNKYSKLLKTN